MAKVGYLVIRGERGSIQTVRGPFSVKSVAMSTAKHLVATRGRPVTVYAVTDRVKL